MTTTLLSPSGINIYHQHWSADGDVKAVLLLVHGLAEHGGRYAEMAAFFTARQCAVFTIDHIGHGLSGGQRCHADSFDDFLQPLSQLLSQIQQQYPAKPVFIIGHSMGGLISARFLIDHQQQLAGCVLSGAALDFSDAVGPLQAQLVRLISKLFPTFGAMQLDATLICRDQAVVQAYRDDPLVHSGKVSARLIAELLKTAQYVNNNAASISLPLLVLHGAEDALTSVKGSQSFFENVSSTDKKLHIYDELFHEIFNETTKLEIFEEISAWLDARL
jgi:alpha-beta hydrolase superfamily lysophospholipase